MQVVYLAMVPPHVDFFGGKSFRVTLYIWQFKLESAFVGVTRTGALIGCGGKLRVPDHQAERQPYDSRLTTR